MLRGYKGKMRPSAWASPFEAQGELKRRPYNAEKGLAARRWPG
jgi:hypothetical protein